MPKVVVPFLPYSLLQKSFIMD